MKKIITVDQAKIIASKLHKEGKTIVLVGGCFDILHIGHITFLENAKKQGDALIVMLESDETIKKRKGNDRPINSQKDRSIILSALTAVDYVILLPEMKNDSAYDILIANIAPDIIAATENDPEIQHKIRQAKMVGGKVISVINRLSDASTSRIAKLLEKEL